jgi:hypothetical protein
MTVKEFIKFLSNSTQNANAEIIFQESSNDLVSFSSTHMCRHCEPEIFVKVPINK